MYYFKVPIFTKLSRIQNIVFISLQATILILSITISMYRGCSYESIIFLDGCSSFEIIPGNTVITNRTNSNWQFKDLKQYSSEIITDIYEIKYYNTLVKYSNGYILFSGNIVLFEKDNTRYNAVFKDFLNKFSYIDFYNLFNKYVDMNNENYNISITNSFLELSFHNNCTTNSILMKTDKGCFFNNYTYNNINEFLNSYFVESFIVPFNCHNCYIKKINTFDELITVLSKCISLFFMLNSFLIILYIFIISKFKKIDIGYINNYIDIDKNIIYEDILLKNEK